MKKLFPFISLILTIGCAEKSEPIATEPPIVFVDSEFFVPEEAKVRRINSPNMEGALKMNGPIDSMYQYYIQNGQKTLRHISYFKNGLEIKRRNFITPKNYTDIFFDYENEKRYHISADGKMSNLTFYKDEKLFRKTFPSFTVENISTGQTDSLAYPNGGNTETKTFDEKGFPLYTISYTPNFNTERNFAWKNGRIISYDEKRIQNGKVISSKKIKWKRNEHGITSHITTYDSFHGKERESSVEYKTEINELGQTVISPLVFGRVNNSYVFDKHGNWINNIYPLAGIEHERVCFYE